MEITYTVDYDKEITAYKDLFKKSRYGTGCIRATTSFLSWIVCFVILIPSVIISRVYGHCFALIFYILIILLFLITSKLLSLKLLNKSHKKALRRAENDTTKIELQDDFISFQNKEGLAQYNWKYVQDIEICEQFVLIKGQHIYKKIPRYIFLTQESFDAFCTQVKTYLQEAEMAKPKQPEKNIKGLHRLPILLGFLVLLFMDPGGSDGHPVYVRSTEKFWQNVFCSEMSTNSYTFDTSNAFKKLIAEDQWCSHVTDLQKKIGPIQSVKTIGYASLEPVVLPDSVDYRAIVLTKINADYQEFYIRSYLKNSGSKDSPFDWLINGYDIITTKELDFETQEFSLPNDRQLTKRKLRFHDAIIEDSLIELSGQGDIEQ